MTNVSYTNCWRKRWESAAGLDSTPEKQLTRPSLWAAALEGACNVDWIPDKLARTHVLLSFFYFPFVKESTFCSFRVNRARDIIYCLFNNVARRTISISYRSPLKVIRIRHFFLNFTPKISSSISKWHILIQKLRLCLKFLYYEWWRLK